MIETAAALLKELLANALPDLDAAPISHGPTVGQMYEGLSGRLLSAALPQGGDLRVVTGFISAGDKQSGQIDRMVVRGTGTRIPETDAYIWPIEDVIAVVEIKKTLTASSLGEAVTQLESVRRIEEEWLMQADREDAGLEPRLALRAYAQMTGRVAPRKDQFKSAPPEDRRLLHTLFMEQYSCLRIVLGVHGHKTEAGLRNAVAGVLDSRIRAGGFKPEVLPQLVISGEFSVAKANGQPYVSTMDGDDWPILISLRSNPLAALLEILWTRLDHLFGMDNPWGDDLRLEVVHKAVLAKPTIGGWTFTVLPVSEGRLAEDGGQSDWEPATVNETEAVLLTELRDLGEINLADLELASWLDQRGSSVDEVVTSLLATRLVAVDGAALVLIVPDCSLAFLPDGTCVVADDSTGRLTRWLRTT